MAAAAISGASLRVRVESSGFLLRKREVSVLMAWTSCFAAAALSSTMSRSQSRLNGSVVELKFVEKSRGHSIEGVRYFSESLLR